MKRFISGFIVGALIFSFIGVFAVSYVANPVDFKVLVNGEEFISDPPALEVEGRTYLPLRAMGEALGVPVNWNEELRQAEVGTTPKTEEKEITISYYNEYKNVPDFGKIFGISEISGNLPLMGSNWRTYKYPAMSENNTEVAEYIKILEKEGFENKKLSSLKDGQTAYMKSKTVIVLSDYSTEFEIMIMEI